MFHLNFAIVPEFGQWYLPAGRNVQFRSHGVLEFQRHVLIQRTGDLQTSIEIFISEIDQSRVAPGYVPENFLRVRDVVFACIVSHFFLKIRRIVIQHPIHDFDL